MTGLSTQLLSYRIFTITLVILSLIVHNAIGQIAPTAVEDEIFTYDNVNASGSLADNDLNPSGSILTYTLLNTTPHGDLILNTDGSWTFSPYPEVAAVNQQMYYQVCDPIGQCSTGLVWLYVQFQNNPPEPEDDYLTVEINEPRFGDVSVNDFDPDYLSDPISTINSYTVLTGPAYGDLIFNIDGTFQYTPDPGFTGNDQFSYFDCDACAVCASANVFITVIPANEDPIATNSSIIAINEDSSYNGSVATLTSDPENDNLTHSLLFQPNHGLVVMNVDGNFQYVPDADYHGPDELMYLVCDIVGQCAVGFVYFNVLNQNDPPITVPSYFTTNEDFPLFSGNAATGDSDDTGNLTYSLLAPPANGTAVVNLNGSFTYSPNPNFFGNDTIYLQVCDDQNACANDFIYFTITPLNDWPAAIADDFFGFEDEILSGSLANDIDVDGNILTYSIVTAGPGGSLIVQSNGDFQFFPNPNFSGFTTSTYQVCDPSNACAQATLILEIIEINDDPIINADTFSGSEDQQVIGSVLTNDIEPDGEIIYYFTTSNPQNGTIVLNANGNFVYTPNPNWSGVEVIQFYGCDPCAVCGQSTLTIQINSVNDLPISTAANFNSQEDVIFNGNISSFNSDIDDVVLNYSLTSAAANGSIILNSNGTFSYTPNANFNGADSFNYQVCDDDNGCVSSLVNLNVLPLNDAPVSNGGSFNTNEDNILNAVIANDTDADGDNLSFSLISQPMNGTLIIQADGAFSYEPNLNYNGPEMATYEVCDDNNACDAGVIEIIVSPVNDPPTTGSLSNVTYQNESLLGNLSNYTSDPDGDGVTFTLMEAPDHGVFLLDEDGTYTYTPVLDFSGNDAIVFQACDPSGACNQGILSITVFTTNTAPNAENVLESINEDQQLLDNLANYVEDAEGGALAFAVTQQPLHGTLTLLPNGNFTYTPNPQYFGADSFSFEVCDTGNMCDEATVNINIQSVNDSPQVFNEIFIVSEDTAYTGDLSTNDTDADGDELSYSVAQFLAEGNLTITSNGQFTFIANPNYFGTVEIAYEVCDIFNACTNGELTIEVISINDLPSAVNDEIFMDEDTPFAGALQELLTDEDDNTHHFAVTEQPEHGTVNISISGNYVFTPDNNFHGIDSFGFSACDDESACTEAIVIINISAINDGPIATDDFRTINEDHSTNGNLGLNDVDADGDALSFTLLNDPEHGTFDIDSFGTFTYTPFDNEYGNEVLQIEICDESACDSSFLYIEILPENDPPVAFNLSTATQEDILLIGDLSTVAEDTDADELNFTITSLATLGTVTWETNGGFVYTPFSDLFGTETLNFQVCDNSNECSFAQLIIELTPVNDAPIANGELIHVLEDSFEQNTVAENDLDVDNDLLIYTLVSGPSFGTFEIEPDGNFTYTPYLDYWGPDQVVYAVCDEQNLCNEAVLELEVDFVNDAPIIVSESIQVIMNQSASGTVADNDIELDDEILTYFIYDDNSNGIFTLNEDGTFEYTPFQNVYGTFTLTYYACDPCAVCGEGTITLYVVPEKDANTPPSTSDFSTSICHGEAIEVEMLNIVQDGEEGATGLNYLFEPVSSGMMMFDSESKVLTYQSDPENDDPILIHYTVCDNGIVPMCAEGELVISVTPDIIPVVTDTSIVSIQCYGQSNGSINVSVQGTTGMQYSWSNSSSTEDINNIPAGDYSLTVSSSATCFISQTFNFQVLQPEALLAAMISASENINDEGNGLINLEISGGTAPYNVTWIGPAGFVSENEDIFDLITQGSYFANVTDNNGCSATANASITSADDLETFLEPIISPNPFSEDLGIRLMSGVSDNMHYTLHDAIGKIIIADKITSVETKLELNQLSSGCYYLTITGNQLSKTWPVIKQ
jgi:large repetitive protein